MLLARGGGVRRLSRRLESPRRRFFLRVIQVTLELSSLCLSPSDIGVLTTTRVRLGMPGNLLAVVDVFLAPI